MSGETSPSQTTTHLQTVITEQLGPQLDSFSFVQNNFFAALRSYSKDFTSDRLWEVEHATLLLEFGVSETMRAIAANQKCITDKIRMAYGFSVAEDAMRVAIFRDLAPTGTFHTYEEDAAANSFDFGLKEMLRSTSVDKVLDAMITSTINFIRADVENFSEVVAIGTP